MSLQVPWMIHRSLCWISWQHPMDFKIRCLASSWLKRRGRICKLQSSSQNWFLEFHIHVDSCWIMLIQAHLLDVDWDRSQKWNGSGKIWSWKVWGSQDLFHDSHAGVLMNCEPLPHADGRIDVKSELRHKAKLSWKKSRTCTFARLRKTSQDFARLRISRVETVERFLCLWHLWRRIAFCSCSQTQRATFWMTRNSTRHRFSGFRNFGCCHTLVPCLPQRSSSILSPPQRQWPPK